MKCYNFELKYPRRVFNGENTFFKVNGCGSEELLAKTEPPINVHNRGGMLNIHYKFEKDLINEISMAGEAKIVFEGELLHER